MKKENIYKFLYCISIFLIIVFGIRLGLDYFHYDSHNNSAPFYVFVLERGIEFIVPSVIVFIVGKLCQKNIKSKNSEDD